MSNGEIDVRTRNAAFNGRGEDRAQVWLVHRYLVDPASSDMLVSKIKPCTCQYKLLYGETANGSLNQL